MSLTKKIVILGDSGVGKTSIFTRFFYDKFDPELLSSIGASFKTAPIEIPANIVRDVKRRLAKIGT